MASPSTFSLSLPLRSPMFTPIPEHDREEEDEEQLPKPVPGGRPSVDGVRTASGNFHNPTPLHRSATVSTAATAPPKSAARNPSRPRGHNGTQSVSVSCGKCRPAPRDKLISVVPLDAGPSHHQHQPSAAAPSPSPGRLLRSLFLSLTRRSPAPDGVAPSAPASAAFREDQWRIVAGELSRKLLHATRKRDEALLEVSRLKYSLAALERNVDRLESGCRDLTAALQPGLAPCPAPGGFQAQSFHLAVSDARAAVSDARAAVRHLARSLIAQIRLTPRSSDRVAGLIQPYDPRAAAQWRRNPGGLLFYMEALLNRIFYAGFEDDEEEEAALLDPAARCEASRAGYEAVRGLGWDEVLTKGTRHYSEALSRFCDRKMSEVVAMVGLTRAWPEALLQAFFGAAKGTWAVRLMARTVHPALPALRADRGMRFDARFMEDAAAERVQQLKPVSVRMMVAPGFHVYTDEAAGVVKCKVLCVYDSCGNNGNGSLNSGGRNSYDRP